jgi:ABC-type dipeptide/oligopeptide/nickel transport system permease subunit
VFLGFLLLLGVALFSVTGLVVMDTDPYSQNLLHTISSPSTSYWFGSDFLGRSIYSRLACGGRYSLFIAACTVGLSCFIGAFLGIIAGYFDNRVDVCIMRLVDFTLAFPGILLAIILAGLLGSSIVTLIAALSAGLWCDYCRLARNITRSLRSRTHVQAGILLGFGAGYILRSYVVPEILPQMTTLASLGMGRTILNIAGLGFLGIGLRPPTPEWGSMINEGIPYLCESPLLVIAPGLMICISVFAFQLLADNLVVGRRKV